MFIRASFAQKLPVKGNNIQGFFAKSLRRVFFSQGFLNEARKRRSHPLGAFRVIVSNRDFFDPKSQNEILSQPGLLDIGICL